MNTSPTNWGVNRDQAGNLWGFAWSEVGGWVKFNPPNGGVSIDPGTGAFSGYAWAENVGWVGFRNQPGATVAYGVDLASYTLKLVFNGTGKGSASSASPSFSCNTNCSQTFLEGTPLKLTAAVSPYSLFGGWLGCDIASGADCDLTLDRDRTTAVTFAKDTEHVARIDGPTLAYFPALQAAYNKAGTGNIVQVWGIDLGESLVCGTIAQVTIMGGYDQQYLNRNGATGIRGLTIGKGTVTVDRIVIR